MNDRDDRIVVQESLVCGCTMTQREDGETRLVFLTPCSTEHREVATRYRKAGSMLVIKSVPK